MQNKSCNTCKTSLFVLIQGLLMTKISEVKIDKHTRLSHTPVLRDGHVTCRLLSSCLMTTVSANYCTMRWEADIRYCDWWLSLEVHMTERKSVSFYACYVCVIEMFYVMQLVCGQLNRSLYTWLQVCQHYLKRLYA